MTKRIPIIAHRGASGHALENTFRAFEKARKLGADAIELDIQRTKDNILVVFHDIDLFRLTGIKRKINECTYEELKSYPLGKGFKRRFSKDRIPSFREVLEWANQYDMPLNIELKETLLENTKPLIDELQKIILPKGSHFSSFHDDLIRLVKMQRPDFETAILVTKKFNWDDIKAKTYFDSINANKKYYKQTYLDVCKEANIGIRFYDINGKEPFLTNPHEMVIGWITDYPDRLKKIKYQVN